MTGFNPVTPLVAEVAGHMLKDRPASATFQLTLATNLQDALDARHLRLVRDPAHPMLCAQCGTEFDEDPEDWTLHDGERIHRHPCADAVEAEHQRQLREGPTRQAFRGHAPGCNLGRSHPYSECAQIAEQAAAPRAPRWPRPHALRCLDDPAHAGDYCTVPDDDEVDLAGVSDG